MTKNKVWVVIPAYNEAKRIGPVLKKTKNFCKNIVVVDDGSKDKTSQVALKTGVTVLTLMVNLGKGAALKTGCDFAVKQGATQIIVMDSDGQHRPERIPDFIKELKSKDIVFGVRGINKNMPFILRFGNNFINKVVEILYNIKISDTQTGYRAFTARAYKKVRWQATDYSMESEMIANAGKHKLKYAQIPIKTIYLDRYKGTTVLTGVKIVIDMFMWRLKWY